MAAPFRGLIEKICVMLVHHNMKFVTKMTDLLESYEYKVLTVNMAPAAMSVLSKGKGKIDMMIINAHSPDSLCFELLKQAVALDIVPLFVCDEYNELIAKKAFDNGACLYLEKSLDKEIVKYLWQFVSIKKIQREKVREGLDANEDHMKYVDEIGNENIVGDKEGKIQSRAIYKMVKRNDCTEWIMDLHAKSTKGAQELDEGSDKLRSERERKGKRVIDEGKGQSNAIYKMVKRNDCTEWIVDLHAKSTKGAAQELDKGSDKLRSERDRKGKRVIDEGKGQSNAIYKIVMRNGCAEWTVDLNNKFKKAAPELDEGRIYCGEQNMTDLSTIVEASNEGDTEESDSNEWKNCDAYFNFDNFD